MKIQKLIIHNIASIADATVDFSAKPLADSDVFLITGKTGSGKSTILDAICLALYGTTPRLDGTKMQGAVSDSGKDVQISDPAQLLSENTGEGYVRLTFEGSNGVPYEAEWSIARARGKATGKLQGKKWSLKDLHSGVAYTKDSEIKAEVSRAVRLSFDQFCRTTMLAQGEFTRFLNSKDEEKAEILEMITGADIYSKIGAKVYALSQEKQKAYEKASQAVQGITLLSEGEKDEKQDEIERNKEGIEAAKASRDECEKKADWLETEATLGKRIEEAEKSHSDAEEAAVDEEFLAEKELVESWDRTKDVRHELAGAEREEKRAAGARESIGRMSGCYSQIHSGVLFLRDKEKSTRERLSAVKSFLEEEKRNLPAIERSQAIEGQLDIIDSGDRAVAGWDADVKAAEKELTDNLLPAEETAKTVFEKTKTVKTGTEKALREADDALEKAGLTDLREQIRAVITEKVAVKVALERLGTLEAAEGKREEEKNAISDKEKELGTRKTERDNLQKAVGTLKDAADAAHTAYEAFRVASDTMVGDIRNHLKVGEICPVCMREITDALPSDAEVAERLRPLREAADTARETYESRKKELDTLEATIRVEESTLTERKKAFNKDTTVSDCRENALEALKECGIETLGEDTKESLNTRMASFDPVLTELNGREKEGQQLEKAVTDARQADSAADKVMKDAEKAYLAAQKKVTDEQAAITRTKSLMEEKKKDIENAVAAIDAIVKGTRWESDWKKRRKEFREELSGAVKTYNEALDEQEGLRQAAESISGEIADVEDILRDIVSLVPLWKDLPEEPAKELSGMKETAQTLKDNILVENKLEQTAREAAAEADGKVEAFLKANEGYDRESLKKLAEYDEETINGYKRHQTAVQNAVLTSKAALDTVTRQAEEHAAKRPVLGEEDTVESLRARQKTFDQQMQTLSGERSVLEAELKTDSENREKVGELAARADALREVRDKWARLEDLIGDSTGKKFRKIAQSYVLGSLVSAANHYMRDLTDRYVLKVVPGTFIISLEDAYQGFVSRPASTISGGESFLVSLSLALALSDIGDSLSVDTLFIDEGFGTLSGEPLQNAVNTLKSLRTKAGRHVGIISHIEELQEKIPVKIMVEQDARNSSSTVRVEG